MVSGLASILRGYAGPLAYTRYVLLECYTDQVLLTVTSAGAGDAMRVIPLKYLIQTNSSSVKPKTLNLPLEFRE